LSASQPQRRVLAIGDIHGTACALETLLDAIAVRPEDQIIALGDYVDRGPDSRRVLERLLTLQKTGQLIALRGNHEQMMLEARDNPDAKSDWLLCGGDTTLASYATGGSGQLTDIPDSHWEFIEHHCITWHEQTAHFFVHANVYPDLPLAYQPTYMLYWEHLEPELSRPHESGKIMVCGHTRQRDGVPLNLGHAICLDTWAYGPGWLTCMDVATGYYWQANQQGEKRTGSLPSPNLYKHRRRR
jgi:serine/threonine protein phosphatase 1